MPSTVVWQPVHRLVVVLYAVGVPLVLAFTWMTPSPWWLAPPQSLVPKVKV